MSDVGTVKVTTNRRSRNIRLSVASGEVRVSKPYGVSKSAVVSFLNKNHDWILKKLVTSKQSKIINDGDILAEGFKVVFESKNDVKDVVITSVGAGFKVTHPATLSADSKQVQQKLIEALVPVWRKQAKKYLPKRLSELANVYDFKYNQLRLKNIHTRWGSCSSAGNINLNIQLMKLDGDLIDHVLLHELSHTKALSHGDDFWEIFETVRPGARQERKQLKQMVIF